MPRKSTSNKKNNKRPGFSRLIKYILVPIVTLIFIVFMLTMFSGPLVNNWRDSFSASMHRSYSGHLKVNQIKGNPFSGFILNDVYFLPESDDKIPVPVWTGETITVKFNIWDLLTGNRRPRTVVLENFTFRFEQNPDGTFKLPPLLPQPSNAQGGSYQLGDIRIIARNSMVIYEENSAFVENPLEYKIENININSCLKKNGELQINNFSSTFLKSTIHASGKIDTKGTLKSDLDIKLKNLGLKSTCEALGRLFPTDEKTRPRGVGDLDLKLTGDLLNPNLAGTGNLQTVTIGNFQIDDIYLNMRYSNKNLIIDDSIAKAYNGRIALTGEIIASSNPAKFIIDTQVINFDLGSYIETNHRDKLNPVSGMFTGKFAGIGYFYDLSTFAGNGYLECDSGMYLNPFRDAGQDQPWKYRADRMGFDKLNIDFKIQNQSLNIENFFLDSRFISIESLGSITFDGDVNAEGIIKAQAELLRSSPYFSDIVRFLPNKDIQVPVKFRLFGPMENLMIHSAIPEDMIDSLLGDDYTRREAAKRLFEKYFGGDVSALTEFIPNITQDQ